MADMRYKADYRLSLLQIAKDTLILCSDPLGEKYTFDRVYQAVNDACMDFCLRTRLIVDTLNIPLKTNEIFYDLEAIAESKSYLKSYGFPLRLAYNGRNNPAMWPTSLAEIDIISDSQLTPGTYTWHLDSVSPGKIVVYGKPTIEGFDDTDFSLDSDLGLIRSISSEDGALPFDDEAALRDIDGSMSFYLIRDSGGNIIRVLTGVSEENNIQCTYVGLPDYIESETDYPDTIPSKFHGILPYKTASLLLEEGNQAEFAKAVEFDSKYERGVGNALAELDRGNTHYDNAYPV